MMSGEDRVAGLDGEKYRTAKGKCDSRNMIYHAKCRHCSKGYGPFFLLFQKTVILLNYFENCVENHYVDPT